MTSIRTWNLSEGPARRERSDATDCECPGSQTRLRLVEGSLTIAGVGLIVLLYSILQAALWADESIHGVEPNSFEWARQRSRQGLARFLRRYGIPAGWVLIIVGLVLAAVSLPVA